jgi:hypothetical protein
VVGGIPVSLKTILKTCDSNMRTVLTDALLGTEVVNLEDVGTPRDSAMVAAWVGNTTREANFLSPGAEVNCYQRIAMVSGHALAVKAQETTHTAKVVRHDISSPSGP